MLRRQRGRKDSATSEDEEREFWAKADANEYFDWGEARSVALTLLGPATRFASVARAPGQEPEDRSATTPVGSRRLTVHVPEMGSALRAFPGRQRISAT